MTDPTPPAAMSDDTLSEQINLLWALLNRFDDAQPVSHPENRDVDRDAHIFLSVAELSTLRDAFMTLQFVQRLRAAPQAPGVRVPDDIAERVLAVGKVEWGATAEIDDAGHIEHLSESLRITQVEHQMPDKTAMHGVYLADGETVLCHTGTSPNSAQHARILTAVWNRLYDEIKANHPAGGA